MSIFKDVIIPILQTILAWPVVFLAIVLIFRVHIIKLISEISELRWGDKAVTRNSQEAKINIKNQGGADVKWDYKKLYLDSFLVQNTINALLWFYQNTGEHSLVSFNQLFTILPNSTVRNDSDEKFVIISTLLNNDLIKINNNNYLITEEGIEYLKYKHLIEDTPALVR